MKIKAKSISNISGTLFFSILFSMFFLISTSYAQEAYITTDRNSYEDGDTIEISGNVGKLSETNPNTAVTVIITEPTGKIFEIAQVIADTSGQFSHNVMADGSMQVNGIYEVIAAYGAQKISTTFSFTASAYTPPAPAEIDIKFDIGSSVPGCELSNSCFNPSSLSVDAGETITWYNADSVAHTVTSGTPADGPDGNFDSSLIMPGSTFSVTLTQPGTYPYFSMMHPWAIGKIIVQGSGTSSSDTTPPQVIVPSDMTIDAGTADYVILDYSAKAIDDVDGAITPTCNLGSGTVFAVGRLASVVVTCTATDSAGNTGSASFILAITSSSDSSLPRVIVPSDMTIAAGTTGYAILEYSVTAIDDVDGAITPTCNLSSGFPVSVGEWLVACTATDSAGNIGYNRFMVTVTPSSDTTPAVPTPESTYEPVPEPIPEPTPEHELEHEPAPAPKPTPTPAPTPVPATPNVHKLTQGKSVKVADGSSVPGCEEFYECYIPYSVRVRPGTPLYWTNFDSEAHTVTSGTPADGPDGIFDSSLFKSGEKFEVTLNNKGTYPYFCMVHPWMIGKVIVSGFPVTSTPTPASAGITVDSSVPSQNNDLSELIEENKKLREELERQGEQINELNQEVDLLKQIIQSIQGFFGSIFG